MVVGEGLAAGGWDLGAAVVAGGLGLGLRAGGGGGCVVTGQNQVVI